MSARNVTTTVWSSSGERIAEWSGVGAFGLGIPPMDYETASACIGALMTGGRITEIEGDRVFVWSMRVEELTSKSNHNTEVHHE